MKELLSRAKKKLEESRSVLLLTHERPDGDAAGSMLGLAWMLKKKGKTVHPVTSDPVNPVFHYLPGFHEIATVLPEAYDLSILVDCGDRDRIGRLAESLTRPPDINIDHHITNSRFADINLVDPEFNAAAEIIAEYAGDLGLELDPESAQCLLAGVVTDTIGFRIASTNLRTLDITRRLMLAGASLPEAMERGLHRRSFTAIRYWGAGLSRLEREGDMIWATLTLAERKAAGYPGRDDADLINILSSIDGVRVIMMFIEQENEEVKISWRVRGGGDITPIAAAFGGGGHPAASGATVKGDLESVRTRVLDATRTWLAETVVPAEKK